MILCKREIVNLVVLKREVLVIIHPGRRVGGDGDGSLGNLKRSEFLGDRIVVQIHLVAFGIQNFVVEVIALCSNVDDALPIRDLELVILCKSIFTDFIRLYREGFVIVYPRARLRRDRDRTLGDLDDPIFFGDLIIGGNVRIGVVQDTVNLVIFLTSDVFDLRRILHDDLVPLCKGRFFDQFAIQIFQYLAVIGPNLVAGEERNRSFFHRQASPRKGERIVFKADLLIVGVTDLKINRIFRRTDSLDLIPYLICDPMPRNQAVIPLLRGNHVAFVGMIRAVVDPALIFRFQCDRPFCDL